MKPEGPDSFSLSNDPVVGEDDAARPLRDLAERVVELAAQLSSLVGGHETQAQHRAYPDTLAEVVERMIEARRERERLFSPALFSDPVWDILLYLLDAEIRQLRISFSTLAERAGIAPTTAHRWVALMVDRGLLAKREDRFDARRIFIELQPDTSRTLREFLSSFAGIPLV